MVSPGGMSRLAAAKAALTPYGNDEKNDTIMITARNAKTILMLLAVITV
jgi:hypothetical protein